MPWVKIDDHFNEHPKLALVGPLGWGIWLAGLAYCNRNLTDGFIPRSIAHTFSDFELVEADDRLTRISRSCGHVGDDITGEWVAAILVEAGIWEEVPGGYRIHDYADYQPTKAQVLAEREQKAAAGRAGGRASAQARAQAPAVAESKPVPVPVPVPVPNPAPKPIEGGRALRKRSTRPPATEIRLSELRKMVADFGPAFGGRQGVIEEIRASRAHKSVSKWKNERIRVQRWLKREAGFRAEHPTAPTRAPPPVPVPTPWGGDPPPYAVPGVNGELKFFSSMEDWEKRHGPDSHYPVELKGKPRKDWKDWR